MLKNLDYLLAQQRRLYLHMQNGGSLTVDDLRRTVESLEALQSERDTMVGDLSLALVSLNVPDHKLEDNEFLRASVTIARSFVRDHVPS